MTWLIWAASSQDQQNGMCAQRWLRSAWASAQSEQSLRCPHEESLGPELPIERTAKTLISLGACPGWSESSLGAHSFCWFCHEAAYIVTCWNRRDNKVVPCQSSLRCSAAVPLFCSFCSWLKTKNDLYQIQNKRISAWLIQHWIIPIFFIINLL